MSVCFYFSTSVSRYVCMFLSREFKVDFIFKVDFMYFSGSVNSWDRIQEDFNDIVDSTGKVKIKRSIILLNL